MSKTILSIQDFARANFPKEHKQHGNVLLGLGDKNSLLRLAFEMGRAYEMAYPSAPSEATDPAPPAVDPNAKPAAGAVQVAGPNAKPADPKGSGR